MRTPQKATALVVAAAVGVGSVAYGLGSQTGDGTASARGEGGAATAQRNFEPGAPPGFDELAETLGVDADELENALRDFHVTQHEERGDAMAGALAKALGKTTDEVSAAFDALQEKRGTRVAARLAQALGVETAAVKTALEELKAEKAADSAERPDLPAFAASLAEKLGVETAKVEEALESLRPEPGARRDHGRHMMPLRQLAAELDVSRAQLRKALREVRTGAESGWEERQAELAAHLADRFDLSVDEVEEALGDLPGPEPGRGHGPGPGPGGPGGPPPSGPGGPPPGGAEGFGPGF